MATIVKVRKGGITFEVREGDAARYLRDGFVLVEEVPEVTELPAPVVPAPPEPAAPADEQPAPLDEMAQKNQDAIERVNKKKAVKDES
jgi:hypothetical protein